jgi:hypothetical protein
MLEVGGGGEDLAHDIMTDDQATNEGGMEEVTTPTDQGETLTIKIGAGVGKVVDGPMSILEATDPNATSLSRPPEGDAASTHSLPVTHVTETQSSQTRPSTARLNSSASLRLPPPVAARNQRYSTVESTVTAGDRATRHRSTVEVWITIQLGQCCRILLFAYASPVVDPTDYQASSRTSFTGEMHHLPHLPEVGCARNDHHPQPKVT